MFWKEIWWDEQRHEWQNAFNFYGNSSSFIVVDQNAILREVTYKKYFETAFELSVKESHL